MPILPVRNLAQYGIITDVDPYNLPAGAWSSGVNVRFHAGTILRAPVFRGVYSLLLSDPRFLTHNTPSTAFSTIHVGYLSGRVSKIVSGTETDISIAGYADAAAETPFTACHLGDVLYVNRADRIPWSLRASDTAFQPLANWNAGWRCGILRAAGNALCAFNISKSGVVYPTMVKTSEFALADTVPSSWDETDPTTNATENILGEMRSQITDAQNLGEIIIVYGLEEAWTMIADGSEEVWSYHKLFDDAGSISANCAVEVDRQHYVFGLHDIYRHDGTSKQSICEERVRDYIFSSMDMSKTNRCFTYYNQRLKEVYFCYPSSDSLTGFPLKDGCNRCAVYSIPDDNWTFYDLPYVYGMSEANINTVTTWDSLSSTWDAMGGSWADQDDSLKRVTIAAGDTDATAGLSKKIYAMDLAGPGSTVSLPVDTNATKGWQLSREGIDLDEVGADLQGYKLLNCIYPQGRMEPGAAVVTFTASAADYFTSAEIPNPPTQTWDAGALYKLDFNLAGRWLAVAMAQNDYKYVAITGLDLEMDVTGER